MKRKKCGKLMRTQSLHDGMEGIKQGIVGEEHCATHGVNEMMAEDRRKGRRGKGNIGNDAIGQKQICSKRI